MYKKMEEDKQNQVAILKTVLEEAESFLLRRNKDTVYPFFPDKEISHIGEEGLGAQGTWDVFKNDYAPYIALDSGQRFYGYVVGGVTPAALAGDWLTSLYDQNAFGLPGCMDRQIELEAVEGNRAFRLPRHRYPDRPLAPAERPDAARLRHRPPPGRRDLGLREPDGKG